MRLAAHLFLERCSAEARDGDHVFLGDLDRALLEILGRRRRASGCRSPGFFCGSAIISSQKTCLPV